MATTEQVLTPTGVKTFTTNDLGEALRVQNEIRNQMLETQNKMRSFMDRPFY